MIRKLYVIENKGEDGKWYPMTHFEASYKREDGEKKLAAKRKRMPALEFRLAIYVYEGVVE